MREQAQESGLPLAAYIRKVLSGLTPPARRPLARAVIVSLNRVGNNLNLLTRLAHRGTLLVADFVAQIEQAREEVRRLREDLERTRNSAT